ncbi:DUF3631 domain-containing protein [Nocardioides flavescens]|uniref:DUF3631 domain-containing protein n=1 Tax=Nocardioides flavescens TaxID=2691959 RepID=A0A6L7EVZ3_9ACTN|nr:DUF3631 domain-containing protein [Nocardioides flavescens]MXG91563.1 DUF3631 domain-containing protein [Nocardioides flavescens]
MTRTMIADLDTNTREDGEVEPDLLSVLPTETLATTLNRLVEFNKRFVRHPHDSTYDLTVLWAAHTHSMQTWRASPRLFIVAPEPGCGKSTQAEVIKFASHAGIRAGSSSAAGLFTIVTTRTVFLDETQNLFTSHPERGVLTAVINDGYLPDGFVLRKAGPVPCYGALAFAGIENGTMPKDTRSRCIPIRMRPGVPAESFDPYDHIAYGDEVRARLKRFSESWTWHKPVPGRFNQIWAALHSVAAAAGEDWPERLRTAQEVHQWPTEDNDQKGILRATRECFAATKADRVSSTHLADYISRDDRLPNVTPKNLAGRLRGYGVEPRKISSMYYFKADLAPVWEEWL